MAVLAVANAATAASTAAVSPFTEASSVVCAIITLFSAFRRSSTKFGCGLQHPSLMSCLDIFKPYHGYWVFTVGDLPYFDRPAAREGAPGALPGFDRRDRRPGR